MTEKIRQGDIPGVQLRYRHRVETDRQTTWRWLLEPENQVRWLADLATPEEGSTTTQVLQSTRSDGRILRERLSTVATDPPGRWIVDLQDLDGGWTVPTRIEFELTTIGEGTEISVLQRGFAHLPLSDCLTIWEGYRRRWRTALTTLASLI